MRSPIAPIIGLCILELLSNTIVSANPSIDQDIIVMSNITSKDDPGQTFVYGEWSFSNGILETANTPSPPDEGIRGILYDRGLSCSVNASDALPAPPNFYNLPRIALIKRGQCFFIQKLLYAQMDGAVGAIVYDNISFASDPTAKYGMTIAPDIINISAYYVDQGVGQELYERLKNITQFNVDNVNNSANGVDGPPRQYLARVTLYSRAVSRTTTWQYGLITVGVVLIASVLTSVILHCHIWRRRHEMERVRQMQEHSIIPMDTYHPVAASFRRILEPSMLDLFPTRIVGHFVKFPVYHEPIGRNAISLTDLREVVVEHSSLQEGKRPKSVYELSVYSDMETEISYSNEEISDGKTADCVVCLDTYDDGDVLRLLPCGHEYHRDCIDLWLTKRSASCPLCKRVLLTGIEQPDIAHIEHGLEEASIIQQASIDDVSTRWERLSENVEIAIRQSPSRHNNNIETTTRLNHTSRY